jgi:DNA-binding response OmpR family regulator
VPHALLVDDDADAAETMAMLIASEGFTVATAGTLRDARRQLALQEPDIVLLDLMLPDGSGMELFDDAKALPNTELVLITGHASLDTSIQAFRLGAADYLVKPMSLKQLQGVLSRRDEAVGAQGGAGDLASQLEHEGHFGALWGTSRRCAASTSRSPASPEPRSRSSSPARAAAARRSSPAPCTT